MSQKVYAVSRSSRHARQLLGRRVRPMGLWLLTTLLVAAPTWAANFPGLYETVVSAADKPRDSSFAEAMRQVAVRVSGTRDAAERVMSGKTPPVPSRYVQQFSFKEDGSAKVSFDSTSFDQLLTSAGLPVWGRERPAVLVWLSLPDASGRSAWQGAMDRLPEREAVEKVAMARGIPLLWPALDAVDLATVAALNTGTRSYEQLTASGERYRADAVLLGTATRDSSGALSVRWSFAFNGEVTELATTLDDGVHLAADTCARVLAVAAGLRVSVAMQVSGIRDLDAYARTLSYLEGLTIVRAVNVQQLQGDRLDVVLAVRGDANALRRTIGLGKRLAARTAAAPTSVSEQLQYEFQP